MESLHRRMGPANVWSEQSNKSKNKLNFTKISWENLMQECLLTEICRENENKKQNCSDLDPRFVMNMRHTTTQIYTEGLKLLRLETQGKLKKLMKQKEEKVIEKEIIKLKQILENHRLSTKKEVFETLNRKIKFSSCIPKSAKNCPKFEKKIKSCERISEVSSGLKHFDQIMTTKNKQNKILFNVKGQVAGSRSLKFFSTQKGSNIENKKHSLEEDKHEIMVRFFRHRHFVINELKEEYDINKKVKNKKQPEIQSKTNQKTTEYIKIWLPYIQQLESRKGVKTMYRNKIEAFLSNLQEGEIKPENKTRHLKDSTNQKCEIEINPLVKRVKMKGKKTASEKKEEMLKKILQEVKISQADTNRRLKEIIRTNSKKLGSNLKFLQKMEKRREERLTHRKEIQEKRLKLKEEKEKAQREREEKKKQDEEEQKQKRLKEMKKNRKFEKEKKLEQKRRMENLELNMKLAKNHYEIYLLRSHGWRPWAMLLKIRDLQFQHAVAFHEKKLTQKAILKWMFHVRERVGLKTANAGKHYERTLQKNCLLIWVELLKGKKEQYQVAADWYEFKITERAFKTWLQFAQDEYLKYLDKKQTAEQFYIRKQKIFYLKKLRNYPKCKKLEQAKEIRKRIWRQKIRAVLPDYNPVNEF